ncbi:MAG: hypothetical protein RLY20_1435 [Verrucomicrobiota bacterium]
MFVCASPAFTQTNTAAPGLTAALIRLLDGIPGFTAHLDLRQLDAKGVETLNAPMQFSFLDAKLRGEIDITKLKAKEMPALAGSAAKSVGMDTMVMIIRPDLHESQQFYPAFKACVYAPIGDDELVPLKKPVKVAKKPAARETVDGHACVKNKVTITDADGVRYEADVWFASDLKNFPLKVKAVDGSGSLELHFSHVKFEKPEAKVFDLPSGTAKYDDPADLSQAVLKKLLGEAFGK